MTFKVKKDTRYYYNKVTFKVATVILKGEKGHQKLVTKSDIERWKGHHLVTKWRIKWKGHKLPILTAKGEKGHQYLDWYFKNGGLQRVQKNS